MRLILETWRYVQILLQDCDNSIVSMVFNYYYVEIYVELLPFYTKELADTSAWNGRPWPGRSPNWMLMYFIINLSGSQQFSGSSIQNQVELSEWATGRFMHWDTMAGMLELNILAVSVNLNYSVLWSSN